MHRSATMLLREPGEVPLLEILHDRARYGPAAVAQSAPHSDWGRWTSRTTSHSQRARAMGRSRSAGAGRARSRAETAVARRRPGAVSGRVPIRISWCARSGYRRSVPNRSNEQRCRIAAALDPAIGFHGGERGWAPNGDRSMPRRRCSRRHPRPRSHRSRAVRRSLVGTARRSRSRRLPRRGAARRLAPRTIGRARGPGRRCHHRRTTPPTAARASGAGCRWRRATRIAADEERVDAEDATETRVSDAVVDERRDRAVRAAAEHVGKDPRGAGDAGEWALGEREGRFEHSGGGGPESDVPGCPDASNRRSSGRSDPASPE